MKSFINRSQEQQELDILADQGGLYVLMGRRRIGKSELIKHWMNQASERSTMAYSQAIESNSTVQFDQIVEDFSETFDFPAKPRTWEELFKVLNLYDKPLVLCIDEFPYLINSDPSLASRFQKWIDTTDKENMLIILAGSSTRMMHTTFLNHNSPLYDRASKIRQLEPMNFSNFLDFLDTDIEKDSAFRLFSMVGGIPKYWEWLELANAFSKKPNDPIDIADRLFFDNGSWMEYEPQRVLTDEKTHTLSSLSILETIGRGSQRPNQIASKIGIAQTNLPKTMQALLDASIIEQEIPFGQSRRNTKQTLYAIQDPTLQAWYSLYSPHKLRWQQYDDEKKLALLDTHCGKVFEQHIRSRHKGAQRYWEAAIELDLVAPIQENELLVAEVKWKILKEQKKKELLNSLQRKFFSSKLSKKYENVTFKVFDRNDM